MSELVEIWKPVVGYEGFYEVSNLGMVKSLDRWVNDRRGSRLIKGVILTIWKARGGYDCVSLNKEGKKQNHPIHRLVCETFLPNPNNLPEVNHKNEQKDCNVVWINEDGSVDYDKSNLEWCDRKYNLHYGTRTKRSGDKHRKSIIQFTKGGELVRKWDSATEAGKVLNINISLIISCCKQRKHNNSAGGFRWEYYNTDRYLIALMIKTLKERKRVA